MVCIFEANIASPLLTLQACLFLNIALVSIPGNQEKLFHTDGISVDTTINFRLIPQYWCHGLLGYTSAASNA